MGDLGSGVRVRLAWPENSAFADTLLMIVVGETIKVYNKSFFLPGDTPVVASLALWVYDKPFDVDRKWIWLGYKSIIMDNNLSEIIDIRSCAYGNTRVVVGVRFSLMETDSLL